jgi:hypothetical protein
MTGRSSSAKATTSRGEPLDVVIQDDVSHGNSFPDD